MRYLSPPSNPTNKGWREVTIGGDHGKDYCNKTPRRNWRFAKFSGYLEILIYTVDESERAGN